MREILRNSLANPCEVSIAWTPKFSIRPVSGKFSPMCGGAAISRGKGGERIEAILRRFPFWFCPNYKKYVGKEEELPYDQNWLLSLIAPRRLMVASASGDAWADPNSEYLGAYAAGEIFRLYGRGFAGPDRFPEPGDEFYYGDYYGVDLRNYALNMTRLYVLVTGNTASSSEAVINTLRGLDGFTVKLIGEKTNGKNVGMEVSKFTVGNYSYELAPISFQGYNAKQVTVNKDGLAVDTACEEWNGELKDYGDRSEPMLAAALSQITGQRSASVSGTRSTAPGVRPATDIALPDLSNRPSGMIVFLPAAEE